VAVKKVVREKQKRERGRVEKLKQRHQEGSKKEKKNPYERIDQHS
jgi:hypothetical protein